MALYTQAGFSIHFQGPTAEREDNKTFVKNFAYSSLLIMPTSSAAELRDHLSSGARDQWPLKHGEKRGWGEEEVVPFLPDQEFLMSCSPLHPQSLKKIYKN